MKIPPYNRIFKHFNRKSTNQDILVSIPGIHSGHFTEYFELELFLQKKKIKNKKTWLYPSYNEPRILSRVVPLNDLILQRFS